MDEEFSRTKNTQVGLAVAFIISAGSSQTWHYLLGATSSSVQTVKVPKSMAKSQGLQLIPPVYKTKTKALADQVKVSPTPAPAVPPPCRACPVPSPCPCSCSCFCFCYCYCYSGLPPESVYRLLVGIPTISKNRYFLKRGKSASKLCKNI